MFPRSLSLPAWVMAKLSPDYCHSLLLTMSEEEKRKFLRGADDGLCCHHSLGSRWVLIGGQLCGRGLRRRVLDLGLFLPTLHVGRGAASGFLLLRLGRGFGLSGRTRFGLRG